MSCIAPARAHAIDPTGIIIPSYTHAPYTTQSKLEHIQCFSMDSPSFVIKSNIVFGFKALYLQLLQVKPIDYVNTYGALNHLQKKSLSFEPTWVF